MKHVWICQCLCPDRHAIMAAVNEAENEAHAQHLKTELRRQVLGLLKAGALNPWCAICGAKLATWRYELGRSRFATMEEAMPHMQQSQAENLAANVVWGDLHRTSKPN